MDIAVGALLAIGCVLFLLYCIGVEIVRRSKRK